VKRCQLDKIGSVTARLGLDRHAILGEDIPARAGAVVAARVLTAKNRYNTLEDVHGRMVSVFPGDVIAGALGHRDALYGYSGHVPDEVRVGDELFLLNLGGVIGAGAQPAAGIGPPFRLEVLGSVLEFPYLARRVGRPACIQRVALPAAPLPAELPPVVALVGTCMDSGKTTAASVLVADWTRRGRRVAAGKLTGVALRRDVLHMQDCGADPVADFTDFGVVTTSEQNALAAAHSLMGHLAESRPDRIVLELGDGLLGTYGVSALLGDPALSSSLTSVVLCAQDPVGALGAVDLLEKRYGLRPALISGRVTDTPVGVRFCEETLGIPAWNALGGGGERAARLLDAAVQVTEVGS
jgi:hypothetical protein